MSRRLHEQRCWEPFETRLLLACLERGSTACDVGANLGYFTVAMALAECAPRQVYAFEPAADNFALLQRNPHYITMFLLIMAPALDTAVRGVVRHVVMGVEASEGVALFWFSLLCPHLRLHVTTQAT